MQSVFLWKMWCWITLVTCWIWLVTWAYQFSNINCNSRENNYWEHKTLEPHLPQILKSSASQLPMQVTPPFLTQVSPSLQEYLEHTSYTNTQWTVAYWLAVCKCLLCCFAAYTFFQCYSYICIAKKCPHLRLHTFYLLDHYRSQGLSWKEAGRHSAQHGTE